MFSEFVATFGLITVIVCRAAVPPWSRSRFAAYIVAAYWFTSSTSFANPAVTIARAFTDNLREFVPSTSRRSCSPRLPAPRSHRCCSAGSCQHRQRRLTTSWRDSSLVMSIFKRLHMRVAISSDMGLTLS
jgi:hypothetical protein